MSNTHAHTFPALSCSLLRWAGWMPGIHTHDNWRTWASGALDIRHDIDSPAVDFVPSMQRRRLSRLSRLSLAVAHACADETQAPLPTVFASQHGEIHRTVGLLTDLARQEPLSPMAFSLSVHNTASGLYSIISNNTAPSTAIAAGCDTLPMAIIEAIGQLQQHERVMVVYAEEPLPAEYQVFATDCVPLGIALLLGKASHSTPQFSLMPRHSQDNPLSTNTADWLRWLVQQTGALTTSGEHFAWQYAWANPSADEAP